MYRLLVIREGEESQEDSLKIISDENFLEAWISILRNWLLDSCSSCDSELSKCLNSQTWQNGLNIQNHAWATKIRPKTEKLNMTSYDKIFIMDHEETSLIQFRDVFHEIWLKTSFYNLWWKKCVSWGSMRKKVWSLMKECLVFENCVRSLSFHTWKFFSSITNF